MKFVVYRDQIYIIKIFALILLPPNFRARQFYEIMPKLHSCIKIVLICTG